MNVYCVTGYPASGKSTATDYLKDKIPVIVMGDIVRRLANERAGIPEDKGREIGEWATEQREIHSQTVFAEETCDIISDEYSEDEKVVIDGIRSVEELSVFEEAFESVTVILIDAPFDVRYKRVVERERDSEESNYTKEDFRERDAQEDGWGLGELVEKADVRIDNTNSLQHLYDNLDSILNL